jgi:hypothetical protein
MLGAGHCNIKLQCTDLTVSGRKTELERWAFAENFLNQFVFTCMYAPYAVNRTNYCRALARNLTEEFRWLTDLMVDHLIGKVTAVQVGV